MARRSRSRPGPEPKRSSHLPAVPAPRTAAAITLALLFTLSVLLWRRQPPDDSVCFTAEADKHPELCGTTTRVCKDGAPAATPRPLVVIAAGPVRSSSTWLYNALRILLRIRDPNTVYGWHLDLHKLYDDYAISTPHTKNATTPSKELASRADAYRSLGTVLIKLHLVQDWHEFNGGGDADTRLWPYVDAVFTTHRDVREVVRSVRDMGWGVRVEPARLAHPDFCRKRKLKKPPTFLRSGQYARTDTWVNLAHAHLTCREALLDAAGDKLKLDLRAEDVRALTLDGTVRVLRDMGRHLDYAYTEAELRAAATELRRLRAPPCAPRFAWEMDVNPVTHLHKGHAQRSKSGVAAAAERRGMAAIGADARCARWLRDHGYAA